ncbi:septum formation family protein [Asanoa sp. WMMD1127]|uniref:septum formation family protein n=1 Tax=Asanoa sp. WMMD1127 TaxID=3016107 RepID=UPI002417299B|nr:septum formation family protein [Asanoa sp. WMMD1127]MDG4824478.1 septum formation family protein [Asanoa sp. WMMD1127]
MRRWWTVGLAGLVAALALAGCGGNPAGVDGDLSDDWRPISEPKPFVPAAEVCHSTAVESGYLAAYAPVDCATTHMTETVHVGEVGDAGAKPPAPGQKPYKTAYGECGAKANAFLGGDWRGARLALTLVLPAPEAWQGGSRWFRCDIAETRSLDDTSMASRDGSLKGALAKPSSLHYGCFTPKISKDIVQEMVAVGCTKTHRSEFVGVYNAPDKAYKTFIDDSETIHKACLNAVATYAKLPKDGNLAFRTGTIYYYPTAAEWDQGNRGVKCFSWDSGRTYTRSIKNGGTSLLPVN